MLASGAFGLGVTGVVVAVLLTGNPASAQGDTTSTAYGVAASGVDSVAGQPSVSSDGATVTKAGDVSSPDGTFTATGISVSAAAGSAKSAVAAVTVGKVTVGPVSATCSQGTVSYTGSGPSSPAANLRVSYGGGAGATINILGAKDQVVQTIVAAVAKCGTGTPPTSPPPTSVPTGRPTGSPTTAPGSNPGRTGTRTPTRPEPAPLPTPREGSGPTVPHVTG
jgi:hypothetical protein